jgi:hypothetical protein
LKVKITVSPSAWEAAPRSVEACAGVTVTPVTFELTPVRCAPWGDVVASAAVSAAFRLVAVAAASAPISNDPVGAGTVVVAASWTVLLVPSACRKVKLKVSPSAGLVARLTVAGVLVTVAPVSVEVTLLSLRP